MPVYQKAVSLLCAILIQFNAFAGWSEAWSYVRDKTKSAAQVTKEWISSHKEEITTVIAGATAVIIACNRGGGSGYSNQPTHRTVSGNIFFIFSKGAAKKLFSFSLSSLLGVPLLEGAGGRSAF